MPDETPNVDDIPTISEIADHVKGIKEEAPEHKAVINGTNGHTEERKRKREDDDVSSKRPKARKASPPWQFGSVTNATVEVDGKRRSARTTATSSPSVQPEDTRPRREHLSSRAAHATSRDRSATKPKSNGHVDNHKRVKSTGHGEANVFRKPGRPPKQQNAMMPKSTGRMRSSSSAKSSSSAPTSSSPSKTYTKRTSRRAEATRRQAEASDEGLNNADSSPGRYQRLKLRWREPMLGRSHPAHWPQQRRYTSLDQWLDSDNALDGETDVPVTDAEIQKEATARLNIVKAMQPGGPLTEARCTRFLETSGKDPPPRYGAWDYVCAHAINFHGLLAKEKEKHKKWAKQIALACQTALATEARWASVREQKTREEIDQEELSYQLRRYKQVVKDVFGAWDLARSEVNKIRFERWEKEQEQLGKKALDEMLDHSTQLLHQHRRRDSSEYPSESRSSIGPTGSDAGTGDYGSVDGSEEDVAETSDASEQDSENMSGSSDSDEDIEVAADDDAQLSPEALRRKYAVALEQIDMGVETEGAQDSSDEHDSDAGGESDENDTTDSDEVSENEGDLDDGEVVEPSLLALMLPKLARPPTDPTNLARESDEIDSKLESAAVSEDASSVTNNGEAIPELEEVDELLLDHSSDESTDMDDGEDSNNAPSDIDHGSSDEDSEEDLGLMGFFGKSKKQASELTNGHSSTTRVGPENMMVVERNDGEMSQALALDETNVVDTHSPHGISRPATPSTPLEKTRTEVPSLLLRGSLREYQHDGLDWLAKLYSGSRNGILADEMGLGKTIQTISLLAHLAVTHKIWGPHLVVVPTSVMLNWEMEFKKWLPGFKILTYYGDIEERKRKRQGWLNDDKWNVCIASYQLILKDAQAFKKRSWHYLILDEAHYIKNFQSQKWQTLLTFKTHSRLLLTGTPLQNDLQELWSLLYFLMPAGLDGSGGFADLEKFLNSMKRPADQILNQGQQKLDAEAQARVYKLHEVLRPFLLRRLKSEVEKQMPGKYEHVVYCRLSKRQRQLYDEFMSRSDTKRTLSSGNYMSIMNCLMSLRKVCNHPDLFETRQIVTSFAMPKSAVADYEIKELFLRRRLLKREDEVDLVHLGYVPTAFEKHSRLHQFRRYYLRAVEPLQQLVEQQRKRVTPTTDEGFAFVSANLLHLTENAKCSVLDNLRGCVRHARRTTDQWPIYGTDFVQLMGLPDRIFPGPLSVKQHRVRKDDETPIDHICESLQRLLPSLNEVAERCEPMVRKFACLTPKVIAEDVKNWTITPAGMDTIERARSLTPTVDPYHEARIRTSIAFPDKRLLQYDCGKLQALDKLLRDLQTGGHRCLIFTQMTKVLDILEQFLNIHGHRYLRLDGATKIEQRQILTDRFNNDNRILAFILSSRSGGLGINLTGADTVIFYDLDWNPAMDAQCQDRCHRIGQTRDVHIYRFVSEHTIEANILRKSNQKRLLDDVIIQKGEFTTDYFNRVTYKDAFNDADELAGEDAEASAAMDRVLGEVTGLGQVLDSVEDKEDAAAAKEAQKEAIYNADDADFNEVSTGARTTRDGTQAPSSGAVDAVAQAARDMAAEEMGPVDDWMVRFLDTYDMKGQPVILPKAVANARKSAARRGRDYRRKR